MLSSSCHQLICQCKNGWVATAHRPLARHELQTLSSVTWLSPACHLLVPRLSPQVSHLCVTCVPLSPSPAPSRVPAAPGDFRSCGNHPCQHCHSTIHRLKLLQISEISRSRVAAAKMEQKMRLPEGLLGRRARKRAVPPNHHSFNNQHQQVEI